MIKNRKAFSNLKEIELEDLDLEDLDTEEDDLTLESSDSVREPVLEEESPEDPDPDAESPGKENAEDSALDTESPKEENAEDPDPDTESPEEDLTDPDLEIWDLSAEESAKPSPGKSRFHANMHIILISAILLIAVISIYRLNKWNRGTVLDTDTEDFDPSAFDVETLDMIIPMDASLLEGRTDDGVTTILCLGNNPFSDDRSDTGLASLIAKKTDSVVYDCGFPDSSAACRYPVYNPEYTKDHFNLYYVTECFRNNEFTAIASIARDEPDPRYTEVVETMQTVDMDKVDVILIMYDSTDYNNGTPSDNPDNPYDVTAFTGGLRVTIDNIKSTWPYIRIFIMSPTYAQYLDEDGEMHNGTMTDLGNGTLNHYLVKESEAAMDCGVSFIDNYFGTINEDNYEDYMADHMHYNDSGREKLAERIADIINNRMDTVNSTVSP